MQVMGYHTMYPKNAVSTSPIVHVIVRCSRLRVIVIDRRYPKRLGIVVKWSEVISATAMSRPRDYFWSSPTRS